MKKLMMFFVLSLLSISIISAAEITLLSPDSKFDRGESLIAKISGNFLENPTRDNVMFSRGVVDNIPFEFEIASINDDFYLYASTVGKSAGNYTLHLENTLYMNGTQESSEPIKINFTIDDKDASFSVKPGFIETDSAFLLEVQNLRQTSIKVNVGTPEGLSSQEEVSLQSGQIKMLSFQPSGSLESFYSEIQLTYQQTSYYVPVFFNSPSDSQISSGSQNQTPSQNNSSSGSPNDETTEDEEMEFSPKTLSLSMATDSEAKRIVYLRNTGSVDLDDLEFSVSKELEDYITIEAEDDFLAAGDALRIEILLESSSNPQDLDGLIVAESEDESASLHLSIEFLADFVPSSGSNSDDEVIATSCGELDGVICQNGQICSGEVAAVNDGVCCLAQCQVQEKSSKGKIFGWLLVIFAFLLLVWFFKRYKRVRPQINPAFRH